MINHTDLLVTAPTYYPNENQIRYYLESAARHNIKPITYGRGIQYTDWVQVQIHGCLEILTTFRTNYPYVLCTDASDVIFLNDKRAILDRYEQLGHPPMLISEEETGPNAGGWMGEIEVAIAILTHLRDFYTGGDPQVRWREALNRGRVHAERDYGNVIFSVNGFPTDACILHLAGGYSDPETGREERILPIWKELGY